MSVLWIVNQYALAADEPGITRHAMLTAGMRRCGWDSVIFASRSHYWNLTRQAQTGAALERRPEATFVRIRTAGHVTNGVRRVLSMLAFSARVLFRALRGRRMGLPRPDVVMGSSPHPFGAVAAYALARRYRVPFVLEVRDLWPDSLVELLKVKPSHPLIRLLRAVEVFLYKRAAAIIAVLPGIEEHVRSLVPDAVPVHWVPNGVDIAALPAVTPLPVRKGLTVMYTGAHGVPNALTTLLQAAHLIQAEEQDVAAESRTAFVLVGDGKEKANLVAAAQRLGLENVTFRDAVPKSEIAELLSSADVLAITWLDTPLYRYGISPNKLFDYFAAGRPVLMALSSRYDPVSDADAGITVPAEDVGAIAQGLRELRDMSPERRSALGRNGREFVEQRHDMAALSAGLAEILDGLVASPAPLRSKPKRSSSV